MDSIQITPVPAFNDNYIWLITHPETGKAIAVDPGTAEPVIQFLSENNLILEAILLTHYHHDHAGGTPDLKSYFPSAQVYGPASSAILANTLTHEVKENDHIVIPDMNLDLSVMALPGHTKIDVAYYQKGAVFSGDTLFSAGCARVFEGTVHQLYESVQRLGALPPDTRLYCGHEYTLENLHFALTADPGNPDIEAYRETALEAKLNKQPTLPSTIALELKVNPFLRCQEPALKAAAEKVSGTAADTPEAVFSALRAWKDRF